MSDATDRMTWGSEAVLSQCLYCKHLAAGPAFACSAFPSVIPPEIVANEVDHREPWIDPATGAAGDKGVPDVASITFEPRSNVPAPALISLFNYLDKIKA